MNAEASVGRVDLLDVLRQTRDHLSGSRAAILVHGPAGIGKSTLVEQAFADLEHGFCGTGKAQQYGSIYPYRPLLDALSEAIGRWSQKASSAEIERLRARMCDFAGTLAGLFPGLDFLWTQKEVPTAPRPAGPRGQVSYALRALVQALTKLAPVVLVLDDLQWVDDETLSRIELGLADPEQHDLLGVFCCRDDPSTLRRARELMSRLSASGVSTREVQVLPLTRAEIGNLLEQQLSLPEVQRETLMDRVCQSSKGSPLYVHHAIRFLASGGILEPSEPQGHEDAILLLLTQRLETFSLPEREVLALAACSGSAVPQAVLARAAARTMPESSFLQTLQKAQAGGLVSVGPAQRGAMVRMSHDRVQEACAGNPTGWPSRHLALWEAGVEEFGEPAQATDAQLFWLMDRELEAVSFLKTHPWRPQAIAIALTASRRARLRAAGGVALRACALAQRLLQPEDTQGLRGEVAVEHAVAAWLSGDVSSFETLAREAERLATPLQLAPVTELRVQEAIARGELGLALEFSHEAICRLLPTHARDRQALSTPALATSIDSLLAELSQLPACRDLLHEAVGRLLSTVNAAAYVAAPEQLPGLVASAIELARAQGAPITFPITLSFWGALLATGEDSMTDAFHVTRLALKLAEASGEGLVRARTSDLAYGMVYCWRGDFRQVIEPLRGNSRLAMRHGTFEYAGYSLLKSLAYRLFAGADLAELAADVDKARAEMAALGQTRIVRYLERDAAVLRRLLEPGPDPCALTDELFQLESLVAELKASDDQYGLLYTAVSRLLVAVVYQQHEPARALFLEAQGYLAGGPGLLHRAMVPWLGALALLGQPSLPAEDLEAVGRGLAFLERIAVFAPTIWRPRCLLLRAELTRHGGRPAEALALYEEAEEIAESEGLPLDLLLIRSRRALVEIERSAFWREWAAAAFRQWRGAPAAVVPSAVDGLEWATRVVTAGSEPALGAALVDLLSRSLGVSQGLVARRGAVALACWNAEADFALDEVRSILRSGHRLLRKELVGVPIFEQDQVAGAIVLADSRGFSSQALAALDNAARLAGAVLSRLGQGRAETVWTEREGLYTTLIHESPAGLFARDRLGRLIMANVAYARAVGLPLHSLLGRTLVDSLPSSLAEEQQKACQSVVDEERPLESLVQMPQAEGGFRDFMVHRVPLRDRNGQVIGMCGVTTDITDLRRAQDELERIRRLQAVGDFAARIAHDLNNMMTVIACNAELLEMTLGQDPTWKRSLGDIGLAVGRAKDLAGQLMMMGESQSPHRELLDLSGLIQECARLARARLPRQARLDTVLAPLQGQVRGDPRLLRRTLDNLLSNAIQALDEEREGRIEVVLSEHEQAPGVAGALQEGRYASIAVIDNGRGMEGRTLQRVFDPYFSTRGEGTGLGLSIVHAAVLAMDGHISATSIPGHGTTFRLFFPFSQASSES